LEKPQLIETLGQIRDCRKYLSAVQLCFPGVCDLIYQVPEEKTKLKEEKEIRSSRESDVTKTMIMNTNLARHNFDMNGKKLFLA
jgi:hypothetical protein